MNRSRIKNRRGTVLIAVLVCMGIVTTIVLGAVQSSMRQRRQLRRELQVEQTRWLLDAGIDKGMARLQVQRDVYEGESLAIATGIERFPEGELEITVLRNSQPDDRIRLRVTARLSGLGESAAVTQRSKEIDIEIANTP